MSQPQDTTTQDATKQDTQMNIKEEMEFGWRWAALTTGILVIPAVAVPFYLHNEREKNRYVNLNDFEERVYTDGDNNETYYDVPKQKENGLVKIWQSIKNVFTTNQSSDDDFNSIEQKYSIVDDDTGIFYEEVYFEHDDFNSSTNRN